MNLDELTPLADMTPEQQKECVGMWAIVDALAKDDLGIIMEIKDEDDYIIAYIPARGKWVTVPYLHTFPRFDLLRAWTLEGVPVPGKWIEKDATMGNAITGETTNTFKLKYFMTKPEQVK